MTKITKKSSEKPKKHNPKSKTQKTKVEETKTKSGLWDRLRDNVMYTLMICLVIFAATPMLLGSTEVREVPPKESFDVLGYYSGEFSQVPVLQNEENYPIFSAQSVYAIDLNSGITLYEKNPDKKLLPASTTKIITSLVALDYYGLDQELIRESFSVEGQKMGLIAGEKMTVGDLLYGLLVFSGNDAAEVLARNYEGGRSKFIEDMNKLSINLGLKDSYFTNPTGLDDPSQVTTARNLAIVSRYAMYNPTFAKIVATREKKVEGTNGIGKHNLTNINELVGTVDGVKGIKTGWTESARENLVTFVERDGKPIIIVVLGSQDRFGESEELIEWIYGSFEWKDVSEIYSAGVVSPSVAP